MRLARTLDIVPIVQSIEFLGKILIDVTQKKY